jgi:hypothetical protein
MNMIRQICKEENCKFSFVFNTVSTERDAIYNYLLLNL